MRVVELPAGPGSGRRERRKVMTRADLIRAGRELFSRKGLYESRIEDLTGHAGIAKGTLYLYFRNKSDLVHAVVQSGYDDLGAYVRRAAPARASLRSCAEGLVRAHVRFFAEHPELLRIFHQARGMLKFHRREWVGLREPLVRHLQLLARMLREAARARALTPAESRRLAELLFGATSGVLSMRAALQPGPAPVALARRLPATVAALLAAHADRLRPGTARGRSARPPAREAAPRKRGSA